MECIELLCDGSRPSPPLTLTPDPALSTEIADRPIDHARLRCRLPDAMPFPHRRDSAPADELFVVLTTNGWRLYEPAYCCMEVDSTALSGGGVVSRVSLRTAQPTNLLRDVATSRRELLDRLLYVKISLLYVGESPRGRVHRPCF